jgi:hypothetical protein
MIKPVAFLCLAIVLASCAQPAPRRGEGEPILNTPLPLGSLGHDLSLSQVVTSEDNGESRSLRVEVEVSAQRLVMVGLTHMGVPLFTLALDSQGLSTTTLNAEVLPFDPRHILSDFQLAHWPREILARDLARRGYQLRGDGKGATRSVHGAKGELLATVEYPQPGDSEADLVIQHYDLPYRLLIHTIERKEGT